MAYSTTRAPRHLAAISLLLTALAACSQPAADGSRTDDIYTQDQGNSIRRRTPVADEMLWTVQLNGCTGHLVSPDTLMAAGHCPIKVGDTYTSGAALNAGQRGDLTISQVLEQAGDDRGLDYMLMRITWASGAAPANQRFPSLIATKASDVQVSPDVGQGDLLFTVGFPVDTRAATYSEGNAKAVDEASKRFYYNMSIINGNSGGGVWRKSDNMLVSLSNYGKHAFNPTDGAWKAGSADDPSDWNWGNPMWDIYAASATLKDIFPNGQNRYAIVGTTPANGVWMALGEGDASTPDAYTLYASVPVAATTVIWCAVSSADQCNDQQASFNPSNFAKTVGTQAVFKGAKATGLTDGMVMTIVAYDAQGAQVATRSVTVKKK